MRNRESRRVVGQLGLGNLRLNLLEGLLGRLALHIGRLVVSLLALAAARLGRGTSLLRRGVASSPVVVVSSGEAASTPCSSRNFFLAVGYMVRALFSVIPALLARRSKPT